MLHPVVWWTFADVSEVTATFINIHKTTRRHKAENDSPRRQNGTNREDDRRTVSSSHELF